MVEILEKKESGQFFITENHSHMYIYMKNIIYIIYHLGIYLDFEREICLAHLILARAG